MYNRSCISVPCGRYVVNREEGDDCTKDDNRPERAGKGGGIVSTSVPDWRLGLSSVDLPIHGCPGGIGCTREELKNPGN